MIIACPVCETRYVVADNAIGAAGRTVRCAKCRHSWFEDGGAAPPAGAADATGAADPGAAADTVETAETVVDSAPAPLASEPATGGDDADVPLAERRTVFAPGHALDAAALRPAEPAAGAAQSAADDLAEPVAVADAAADEPVQAEPELGAPAFAEFDEEPRSRRGAGRWWTAAAVAFAVLVAALIGAVSVWGMPDWVPVGRSTFAEAQPDLVLEFPAERQDRRTLTNGAEYFGASGSVTNIGRETRRVPPILIVLRDASDRIVYTWEVAPPKPALAPGESVTINEAVTDVPPSARVAQIGWKPS